MTVYELIQELVGHHPDTDVFVVVGDIPLPIESVDILIRELPDKSLAGGPSIMVAQ